jgi:hypothetical protein
MPEEFIVFQRCYLCTITSKNTKSVQKTNKLLGKRCSSGLKGIRGAEATVQPWLQQFGLRWRQLHFSNVNSLYLRPFCGKSCIMASEWLSDLFSPEVRP